MEFLADLKQGITQLHDLPHKALFRYPDESDVYMVIKYAGFLDRDEPAMQHLDKNALNKVRFAVNLNERILYLLDGKIDVIEVESDYHVLSFYDKR
jgi:hypothetical protein